MELITHCEKGQEGCACDGCRLFPLVGWSLDSRHIFLPLLIKYIAWHRCCPGSAAPPGWKCLLCLPAQHLEHAGDPSRQAGTLGHWSRVVTRGQHGSSGSTSVCGVRAGWVWSCCGELSGACAILQHGSFGGISVIKKALVAAQTSTSWPEASWLLFRVIVRQCTGAVSPWIILGPNKTSTPGTVYITVFNAAKSQRRLSRSWLMP